MNLLFKVREFVWVIVSEIEDWVYPYRTRLSPEEKYEHGMRDPMTGEITMIENLLQADNERIQRLQDEMINIQNRVYEIEDNLKSINTYSKKSNQINPNEGQESSENDDYVHVSAPTPSAAAAAIDFTKLSWKEKEAVLFELFRKIETSVVSE